MNARTLNESRHSLWMERLRTYNERLNAGEKREGLQDLDTLAAQAAAVVDELEHIAGVLGSELDA